MKAILKISIGLWQSNNKRLSQNRHSGNRENDFIIKKFQSENKANIIKENAKLSIFGNNENLYNGYYFKKQKMEKDKLNFKLKDDYYDGQFKYQIHEIGKFCFSNKVIYNGFFQIDQMSGKEPLNLKNKWAMNFINQEGGIHEGQFKDDLKHRFQKTIKMDWRQKRIKEWYTKRIINFLQQI